MLHVDLELNRDIEVQLRQVVSRDFNCSYEKFIEASLQIRTSVLK
jgi:hypothetical protein